MVILLQACGGLVVVVVKCADNILKGFAASFSIITACLISYLFLDFQPTVLFVIGATLVLSSSYMYEGLPASLFWLKGVLFLVIQRYTHDGSKDKMDNDERSMVAPPIGSIQRSKEEV